jgi:hypothetical protein
MIAEHKIFQESVSNSRALGSSGDQGIQAVCTPSQLIFHTIRCDRRVEQTLNTYKTPKMKTYTTRITCVIDWLLTCTNMG